MIRHFILLFVPTACVLVLLSGWAVFVDARHRFDQLVSRESARVEVARKTLGRDLHAIVSDLRMVAESSLLRSYLESGGDTERRHLENYIADLVEARGVYDQIRYLDNTGWEVVRVNFQYGKPVRVPVGELQEKSHRYYFEETMQQAVGEVYISRLDLNVEWDRIEFPRKPMLRIATTVRDPSGETRGMVVFNYLAANLLAHFRELMSGSDVEPMLLDVDGFWLTGSDPAQNWGMMDEKGPFFGGRFPDVWREISPGVSGQVLTGEGLFVFGSAFPLSWVVGRSTGGYPWIIVAHVPESRLPAVTPWQYVVVTLLLSALLLVTAIVSWLLARARINRQQIAARECELQAELAHMGRVSLVGELTTTLAHEINNPLGNIANYAGSCVNRINRGTTAESLAPMLKKIQQQAYSAAEIIKQIRGFVTKEPKACGPVDLRVALQESFVLLERNLERDNVSVSTDLSADVPPVAIAKTQLEQILINLLLNGIDAVRREDKTNRRIFIEGRLNPAGMVEVTVADTGPIEKLPERLFESFYSTKPDGLGMGLAICRTLVEEQGGRIWASINGARGLKVWFTLPGATMERNP